METSSTIFANGVARVVARAMRRSVITGSIATLLLGYFAPAAHSAPGLIYTRSPAPWSDGLELWVADASGGNRRQIPTGVAGMQAPQVSPDGGEIAFTSSDGGVFLINPDGTGKRNILPRPNNQTWWDRVQWLPSGTALIVTKHVQRPAETSGGYDINEWSIWRVDADGTNLGEVVAWPGVIGPEHGSTGPDQRHAAVSPDGTKIAFASGTTPSGVSTGAHTIWLADVDGTDPLQLTTADGPYQVPEGARAYADQDWPSFAPDGQTLVYQGESRKFHPDLGASYFDIDLFRVGTDGLGHASVTSSWNRNEYAPAWRDADIVGFISRPWWGGESEFRTILSSGSSEASFIDEGDHNYGHPSWGTYPTTTAGQNLARYFEQVLRFDTSEKWRPLNADSFFAEGNHQVCDEAGCSPIHSPVDLGSAYSEAAFIDINGRYSPPASFETSYHSPYDECTVSDLRDCDTGPRSAMYYRITEPYSYPPGAGTGSYRYIDYWFFYRFNYFLGAAPLGSAGLHEGDWEAVTIAPSLTNATTFDFAALSQHGTFYTYLRDNLRCQQAPSDDPPAQGSCGTETAKTGRRLAVMVANGSHANYAKPCSETFSFASCRQNGSGVVERGYDGRKQWGRAFDDPATSLLVMPPLASGSHPASPAQWNAGPKSWTDWPGRWGKEDDGPGAGPLSPGNQTVSVGCATLDNSGGCPNPGPRMARSPSASSVRGVSPGVLAERCERWLGGGVAAVTCDPAKLRSAVRRGTVGRRGALSVGVRGLRSTRAAGSGIAQFMGRPVKPGAVIRARGRGLHKAMLLLRIQPHGARKVIRARFRLGRVAPARTARASRALRTVDVRLRLQVVHGKLKPRLIGPAGVTVRADP